MSEFAQPISATTEAHHRAPQSHNRVVLERIDDALRGLRFGTVTVIVQDGVVVQVDRTEKLRFPHP